MDAQVQEFAELFEQLGPEERRELLVELERCLMASLEKKPQEVKSYERRA
jgi:hypothetical protein